MSFVQGRVCMVAAYFSSQSQYQSQRGLTLGSGYSSIEFSFGMVAPGGVSELRGVMPRLKFGTSFVQCRVCMVAAYFSSQSQCQSQRGPDSRL